MFLRVSCASFSTLTLSSSTNKDPVDTARNASSVTLINADVLQCALGSAFVVGQNLVIRYAALVGTRIAVQQRKPAASDSGNRVGRILRV